MSGMGNQSMSGYYTPFRPITMDESGQKTFFPGYHLKDEYKAAKKEGNTSGAYYYTSSLDQESKAAYDKEDYANVNWRYLRDQGWDLAKIQKYHPFVTDLKGDEGSMLADYAESGGFGEQKVAMNGEGWKPKRDVDFYTASKGWLPGATNAGNAVPSESSVMYGSGKKAFLNRSTQSAGADGSAQNRLWGWLQNK